MAEPQLEQEVPPLIRWANSQNIAAELDQQTLTKIAAQVKEEYDQDLKTMTDWLAGLSTSMKLAKQVKEDKTFPWAGASNIKMPDLKSAILKWAAKSYQKLLSGDDWVKAETPGQRYQDDGRQAGVESRGGRIAAYMNYQLMHEMDGWEDDFDTKMHMLPWAGCLHKKTYFDPAEGRNISELVFPEDLVINQGTISLDRARVSHKIRLDGNEYREMVNGGLYLDVASVDADNEYLESDGPRHFIECHGWYDLDGDGYKEPYTMTLHEGTQKIVRMLARYNPKLIKTTEDGRIWRIPAVKTFTKYGMYPAPDGSYWSEGWGHQVGPIIEAINTLMNQLIDAGTLANLGAGAVDGRLRLLDGGKWTFKPGEWKRVKTNLSKLSDAFHGLPAQEPSMVLFSLLQMLTEKVKELAATPDLVAESLPANAPVGTTLAKLDESEKVNNAVDKRLYRAMSKEFKQLYRLNGRYGDPMHYAKVLNLSVAQPGQMPQEGEMAPEQLVQLWQADHSPEDLDVIPSANPETSSRMMRLSQADYAMSQGERTVALGGQVNPQALFNESLEAAGIEKPERFEPPPPTEEQIEAQEAAADKEEIASVLSLEALNQEVDKLRLENQELMAKIQTEEEEPAKVKAEVKKLNADASRPNPGSRP